MSCIQGHTASKWYSWISEPHLHIHNPCPFLLTFLVTALRSSELWFSHQHKWPYCPFACLTKKCKGYKIKWCKKYPENLKILYMYRRVIVILWFFYRGFIIFAFSFSSSTYFKLVWSKNWRFFFPYVDIQLFQQQWLKYLSFPTFNCLALINKQVPYLWIYVFELMNAILGTA